jgi:hypothetical protein
LPVGLGDFNPVLRGFPLGGEPLQPADGHGGALAIENTFVLALLFLGTDPAANGRQAVLLLQDANGSRKILCGDPVDEAGNIDLDRAALHAERVFTLQAAFGFADGQFGRIAQRHFLKIASSDMRGLLGHVLAL